MNLKEFNGQPIRVYFEYYSGEKIDKVQDASIAKSKAIL